MSDDLEKVVQNLKTLRDEIKVQLHLAKAELKDEWEELEPRFEEMEDYVAAASSHQGILSGANEYLIFGRNEPALHHYHNTYREALGLPPLEAFSN
jgi:5'-deoxynucleotidase YfbR-like HD superfamily hydrolase